MNNVTATQHTDLYIDNTTAHTQTHTFNGALTLVCFAYNIDDVQGF